jgi:hypothetical protein
MNCRLILATGLAAMSALAAAHERFFVFTYDWFTPARFEREFEFTYDHFQSGNGFGQIEFEYGVTDRWVVAPYLLVEHKNGKAKLAGWQLEQRYRLGEFAYGKVLPAVYFEVHKESHKAYELEGKLIGSYMPNSKWIASGNFIVEQKIESGARMEFGYAAGIARIFPKWSVGLEAKGNFLANEHIFGPTVGLNLGLGTKLNIGVGQSFGRAAESRVRVLFEKEF